MILYLAKSTQLRSNHVISNIANSTNFDAKKFHYRIQMQSSMYKFLLTLNLSQVCHPDYGMVSTSIFGAVQVPKPTTLQATEQLTSTPVCHFQENPLIAVFPLGSNEPVMNWPFLFYLFFFLLAFLKKNLRLYYKGIFPYFFFPSFVYTHI